MKRCWWKEAVGYELYPRSFKDTNGDGVGDLPGIIEKLPYLKELGIDLLWICPFYPSPMKDNGYDVADYYGIDPQFGTMEDMETLLRQAKELGIRVIIDMVLNHTSDQHPWFQEALRNPESSYRDYYIFRRGEEPPSNIRSCFGGSVWTQAEEKLWYYHTFDKSQPDLNWDCPQLRQEIYKLLNYWLDKGISGFRLDAITYIKKGASLQMAQEVDADGLHDIADVGQNQPGIGDYLLEMKKACMDGRDAMTVAEAPGVLDGQLGRFAGDDGYFSMIFDFRYADIDLAPGGNWYRQADWTYRDLKRLIFESQYNVQKAGWGAVYLENHDQPRSLNKYFREKAAKAGDLEKRFLQGSALATLLLGLRGTVFLYQGQELGMINCPFQAEEFDDLNTIDQYQRALQAGFGEKEALKFACDRSRDNSRTPYPWNGEKNAGFTSGQPWLKVNPDYVHNNAKLQLEKENSLFRFYQKLIALRKEEPYKEILVYGRIKELPAEADGLLAFERVSQRGDRIRVFVNLEERDFCLNEAEEALLSHNYKDVCKKSGRLVLRPYEALMLYKA